MKTINEREKIIFGEDFDKDNYKTGLRRFKNLSSESLRELVNKGFAYPEEATNYAPSIKEFMLYGNKHKDVSFGGFADESSIVVDEIHQFFDTSEDIVDFVSNFREADEFDLSLKTGRAWWD